MNPMVTVIMPVYNAEKYLDLAIESILNQSYRDFEFIIINDGSTDRSGEIIASYEDSRIVSVLNEVNLRLVKTLNKGLKMARGKYIARMDADDISLPNRLAEQVDYMECHSDFGVCGAFYRTVGLPININMIYPEFDEDIKAALLFQNPIPHPGVMVRRSVLEKLPVCYAEEYLYAEDYDLWSRLIPYTRFYNIPKVLFRYRLGHAHISSEHGEQQRALNEKIIRRNLAAFELEDSLDVFFEEKSLNQTERLRVLFWDIIERNKSAKLFSPESLQRILAFVEFDFLQKKAGITDLVQYAMRHSKSDLSRIVKIKIKNLFIKAQISYLNGKA